MPNHGAADPNPRSTRAYERVPSRRMPKRLEVDIDGRTLSLSNLDKVFYPETGFTKGQVIDYYTRIAPAVLPHLRGRALTLKRYPNGVNGGHFYEKQCPSHRPDWVATAPVWSRHNARTIEYCLPDHLRRDKAGRARACPGPRAPPPGARRLRHEEGAAPRQGARRLEPERRAQDDGVRLLAARPRAADGVHAARLGRGRGRPRVGR